MGSTFFGLEISKRGLFTQRTALHTTGHNIANTNTPGYSRQVVDMQATRPMEAPGVMRSNAPGQVGTGVAATGIRRIREAFLDDQFRNENKSLGEWTVRSDALEKLQAIMNEPSDTGFATVLDNFWNAWEDLSRPDNPDNLTARAVLKERAVALVETLNQTAAKLADLNNDLTQNISVKVSEVNTLLNQVASLNGQIARIEALGDQANDLRDQRDLLVDQLSKIINVSVTQQSNGYRLTMGGVELVNGATVSQPLDAAAVIGQAASGDLSSGELYGLIVSRDIYVSNYIDQLDALAKTLATGEVQITLPAGSVVPDGTVLPAGTKLKDGTVLAQDTAVTGSIDARTLDSDATITVKGINGLQHLGYTLQEPLQQGMDFFIIKPGFSDFTAASIQVNPAILANVNNIAASTATYMGADNQEHVLRGNGELALITAGLRDVSFNFDPNNSGKPILTDGTFNEFVNAYIGQLGVQGQEAKRQTENQQILVDQVDNRRQSVSGVSLDEEMANMIRFQQAYNAAARMVTTVDEMLDKVINGMGRVGR